MTLKEASMMIRFNSSVGQVVKAWINPRTITTVEIPVTPIDTESLFGLFDRYNATTFYAGGGGGGKGGRAIDAAPLVPAITSHRLTRDLNYPQLTPVKSDGLRVT